MPPLGNEEHFHGAQEEGEEEEYFNKPSMASIISSSACSPVTLKFIDICYRVKLRARDSGGGGLRRMLGSEPLAPAVEERIILDGVTGMAAPGELLAVLGPSGSGKSTLLSVLAGRLAGRHAGTVLANGKRISRSVLRRTGYVPQDDVLYPHLTVRETLVYCALLRLPRGVARQEKVAAADAVIAGLGLGKCRDTAVGGALVRGVSGGERRRVSIGHEVLLDPAVLVLDEPTSGLDATAAHRLLARLAGMARREGRTVVAALHQPSSRAFQMFDAVLLLGEGRCLYFGRAGDVMSYLASAGFAPRFPVNPADFMLDLANGFAQTDHQGDAEKSNVKQSLLSSYNRLLAPVVKASVEATTMGDTIQIESQRYDKEKKNYARITWFSQFAILLQRSLKERRHEAFNSLRVSQVMAAAVLAGAMWWHSSIYDVRDRLGLLFFITIFWGVLPSFNAVFAFPQDRAIVAKERASGMYSLSSYFMARMAGDIPMELILPSVFILTAYWMAGLRLEFSAFMLTLAVLLGYVLVAQGLGLALGAVIMDAKQASTVVTVTMLAFLLTGGFYVRHVPACLSWLKYTSFTFYCYRLLIAVQYRGIDLASAVISHQRNGSSIQERELDGEVSSKLCVIVLAVMFVAYRLLAYAALRRLKA